MQFSLRWNLALMDHQSRTLVWNCVCQTWKTLAM